MVVMNFILWEKKKTHQHCQMKFAIMIVKAQFADA